MKFYTSMPKSLLPHFKNELEHYRVEYNDSNLDKAWIHLERAHIIGQRYPYTHCYVHWRMLQFGFKIKSVKEIIGQIPRLILGGVFSFVGKVPVGNPGGSNVPPLKPFPVEKEIQDMFLKAGIDFKKE